MEPNDNTAKVCEGIVELDESQQAKLEEIERSLKHGFKRLNAAKWLSEPTRLLPPPLSLCCVQAFEAMFGMFFNKLCNILAKNQDWRSIVLDLYF